MLTCTVIIVAASSIVPAAGLARTDPALGVTELCGFRYGTASPFGDALPGSSMRQCRTAASRPRRLGDGGTWTNVRPMGQGARKMSVSAAGRSQPHNSVPVDMPWRA
jgi:hypothetical protein